ncbi:uncharacterized protein LOC127240898 [Andrographis paniculata]|uniref:uncharacterized protein LOC127240898 n=1 Tax=Andrographis paniculata TaxID=175694 RepID=UPI0021E98627|nr:uncharacterized protein LOC127240898 [Andrographis paniculata]
MAGSPGYTHGSPPPMVFPPIPERAIPHLKPLYVNAHICGKPINKVFIDNGAVFNVMPLKTLRKLGKEIGDLSPVDIEMTSFTGQPTKPEGMIVAFIEVGPKVISTEGDQVFRMDANTNPFGSIEVVEKSVPKMVRVSGLLSKNQQEQMVTLIRVHMECMAWDYSEMPGLAHDLIEHRLLIKKGFRPYKQPPIRVSPELLPQIKEEIEKLLKVGFIQPCRYAEWLANIVLDEYVMPIANMLIDSAAGHQILSLIDGYAGYNQISLAEEDIPKTAFRCLGALGIYEWTVMPFGLKNAEATYQWAMNTIFHDLIGQSMEVYIDDVIIKSKDFDTHLADLKNVFLRMKQYNLKMNPTKCAFGVSAGNFLGFLVHEKGIEVDANKTKAVLTVQPPRSVKEVQSLLGKVNYLRRFISNAAGKLKPITKLLKNKATDFSWGPEQQEALTKPPVLVPPRGDQPIRLFVANSFDVMSSLLPQEWEDDKERAINYLSKTLAGPELNYTMPEKMCFSLVFACTRLEHYILPRETEVVSKVDMIRLIMHKPTMQGRLMKWAIKLAPFALQHRPIKAVKGQVVAKLLAEFSNNEPVENKMVPYIGSSPWKMFFDGSRSKGKSVAGVILEGPGARKISLQLQMEKMTHNSAEYESFILGLEALVAKGAQTVMICGDSQPVINQVLKRYACNYPHLRQYRDLVYHLLYRIAEVLIEHVPRTENRQADNLAQNACQQIIGNVDTNNDWRTEIMIYLESPNSVTPVSIRLKALRFQLIEGVLYKRTFEGVLLRCLGPEESIKVIEEVNGGICEAHRAGLNMRWAIHCMGFYWPKIFDDCIRFGKGCRECQRHGPLNHLPTVHDVTIMTELDPIIIPHGPITRSRARKFQLAITKCAKLQMDATAELYNDDQNKPCILLEIGSQVPRTIRPGAPYKALDLP